MTKNTALPPRPALDIIDFLYNNYFSANSTYSSATSSHWKKMGEFQKVEKVNDVYQLSGEGFGEFRSKNLFSIVTGLPTQIYLMQMLRGCDKQTLQAAKKIAKATNRDFSYDLARMVLTVDLLKKHTGDFNGKRIVIIGDGYGSLGCLFKACYPSARITYINLGRTLTFDAYYSDCAFPNSNHKLISSASDILCEDFNYIEAERVSEFMIEGDLFVNIASMQEMNPDVISEYFKIIRGQDKDTLFYCCNRIEKSLPDGTITKFFEYDWLETDEIVIDELCSWHQRAPKVRPPFVYKFDGPIQHRLVKIKPVQ